MKQMTATQFIRTMMRQDWRNKSTRLMSFGPAEGHGWATNTYWAMRTEHVPPGIPMLDEGTYRHSTKDGWVSDDTPVPMSEPLRKVTSNPVEALTVAPDFHSQRRNGGIGSRCIQVEYDRNGDIEQELYRFQRPGAPSADRRAVYVNRTFMDGVEACVGQRLVWGYSPKLSGFVGYDPRIDAEIGAGNMNPALTDALVALIMEVRR